MVETIAPVVYGGTGRKYYTAVLLHALGATASATLLGLLLGAVGGLLGAPWEGAGPIVIAVVALVYALRELLKLPVPLPDMDQQVPDWWRTFYSHNVAALLYGLGLGVGFFTYLSFGTLAAVAAGAFVSSDPLTGMLILAPFGLMRGLSVLVNVRAEPESIVNRLAERGPRLAARLINGVALVLVGFVALVLA